MAEGDWEHKDATWNSHRNSADGELSDWLDNHCEGGWELHKMSSRQDEYGISRFCVFRRRKE